MNCEVCGSDSAYIEFEYIVCPICGSCILIFERLEED